jgi:formiminotetrahydrofolate cyclodeaminase
MLMDMSIKNFLSLLSSDAPAPGGGSVSALNGALGAALLSMVCRLSVGRKELDQYEEELLSALETAEKIRNELTTLVDLDTTAFNQVMNAFKMPKITDQEKSMRAEAIQNAFNTATEVPLKIARLCYSLLELSLSISQKSNSNTFSDLGVSTQCFYSAIIGALMNVEINTPRINDKVYVSNIENEINLLRSNVESLKAEIDFRRQNILPSQKYFYRNKDINVEN